MTQNYGFELFYIYIYIESSIKKTGYLYVFLNMGFENVVKFVCFFTRFFRVQCNVYVKHLTVLMNLYDTFNDSEFPRYE